MDICSGVIYQSNGETELCTHDAVQGRFCAGHAAVDRYNRWLQELHDAGLHGYCNPLVSECCFGEDPNDRDRLARWRTLEEVAQGGA